MPKPILAGHDPHERNDFAPARFGVAMAELTGAPLVIEIVSLRAPLVLISSLQNLPYAVGHGADDVDAACTAVMEEIGPDVSAHQVKVECRPLQDTSAARALHAAAEAEDAGLLIVGGRSRTAASLLSGAPCSVASVPPSSAATLPIRAVAVAYAGGEEGDAALRGAEVLARKAGATLRILTVADDAEAGARVRARVDEVLGAGAAEVEILSGDPAEALVRASAGLDLLVMGSRGYGPVRAVLLGSVSRRVVEEAGCPVIVVPRGVRTPLEALAGETAGVTASP